MPAQAQCPRQLHWPVVLLNVPIQPWEKFIKNSKCPISTTCTAPACPDGPVGCGHAGHRSWPFGSADNADVAVFGVVLIFAEFVCDDLPIGDENASKNVKKNFLII